VGGEVKPSEYHKILHSLFLASKSLYQDGRLYSVVDLQVISDVLHSWLEVKSARGMILHDEVSNNVSLSYPDETD
jgi:hypothetical protein